MTIITDFICDGEVKSESTNPVIIKNLLLKPSMAAGYVLNEGNKIDSSQPLILYTSLNFRLSGNQNYDHQMIYPAIDLSKEFKNILEPLILRRDVTTQRYLNDISEDFEYNSKSGVGFLLTTQELYAIYRPMLNDINKFLTNHYTK